MTPLHGLDILVAEDHYFVATELSQVLRQLGAAVVGPFARLPLEPSVAGRPIDLALLDVELDRGTSFPLADEMVRRGVPIALITGYEPGMIPPPYQTLLRLDKPIDWNKLTAAVLRLTGRLEGIPA